MFQFLFTFNADFAILSRFESAAAQLAAKERHDAAKRGDPISRVVREHGGGLLHFDSNSMGGSPSGLSRSGTYGRRGLGSLEIDGQPKHCQRGCDPGRRFFGGRPARLRSFGAEHVVLRRGNRVPFRMASQVTGNDGWRGFSVLP